MAIYRHKLSGRPSHVATVLAVLVMAGAAFQYDDLPTGFLGGDVDERLYQDDIGLDTDTQTNDQKLENIMDKAYLLGTSEANSALVLYKIMEALRLRSENPGQYIRPISESVDYLDIKQFPVSVDMKETVAKRLTNVPKQDDAKKDLKLPQVVRPQQKWKAKKKLRGFICYFKLCGFRPPS